MTSRQNQLRPDKLVVKRIKFDCQTTPSKRRRTTFSDINQLTDSMTPAVWARIEYYRGATLDAKVPPLTPYGSVELGVPAVDYEGRRLSRRKQHQLLANLTVDTDLNPERHKEVMQNHEFNLDRSYIDYEVDESGLIISARPVLVMMDNRLR